MSGDFQRLVKFKDRKGKYHLYLATYKNFRMIPSDWEEIQRIKNA